jgi:hypothetical protein
MNPDAKVEMLGVQVGKVASICRAAGWRSGHSAGDGPSRLQRIPANVLVDIGTDLGHLIRVLVGDMPFEHVGRLDEVIVDGDEDEVVHFHVVLLRYWVAATHSHRCGTTNLLLAQNADMTDAFVQVYRVCEGLPVVGGLLRRQRREAERVVSGLIDALLRDSIGLDAIVRRLLDIDAIVARLDIGEIAARLDIDAIVSRLDLGAIVARLDIGEVVARLDIDAIVSRLDLGAIVARLDVDAIVGRLDMNEVVASLDFSKLADQVVEDVDLPKVIMQAGSSVVRGRRPQNRT